jgi:hypothetical protein
MFFLYYTKADQKIKEYIMTLNPFRGKEQKSSSGVNTATSSKSDKSASSTPTVRELETHHLL